VNRCLHPTTPKHLWRQKSVFRRSSSDRSGWRCVHLRSARLGGGLVCAWSTYFWSPFACLQRSRPVWGHFICTLMQAVLCLPIIAFASAITNFRAGCVCLLQLFIKLILGLFFWVICWCMYVGERVVEKSAFYSDHAGTLVDWCKVFNQMWLNFEPTRKAYIPRGQLLVFFPFAVGLNRVDLSHFFFFLFRNKCFFVDRELAHHTTSWRRRATWPPFRHPVIPLQSAASLGSDAVCSRSSGDQTLLFPHFYFYIIYLKLFFFN
jgi:hypothetical protein